MSSNKGFKNTPYVVINLEQRNIMYVDEKVFEDVARDTLYVTMHEGLILGYSDLRFEFKIEDLKRIVKSCRIKGLAFRGKPERGLILAIKVWKQTLSLWFKYLIPQALENIDEVLNKARTLMNIMVDVFFKGDRDVKGFISIYVRKESSSFIDDVILNLDGRTYTMSLPISLLHEAFGRICLVGFILGFK